MIMTLEDIALCRTILLTSRDRLHELRSQLFKGAGGPHRFFNQGSIAQQHETISTFAHHVEILYTVLESPEKIVEEGAIHGNLDRVLSADIAEIGDKCVDFFPDGSAEKEEAISLKEVMVELFEDAQEKFYLTICGSDQADAPSVSPSLKVS